MNNFTNRQLLFKFLKKEKLYHKIQKDEFDFINDNPIEIISHISHVQKKFEVYIKWEEFLLEYIYNTTKKNILDYFLTINNIKSLFYDNLKNKDYVFLKHSMRMIFIHSFLWNKTNQGNQFWLNYSLKFNEFINRIFKINDKVII